MESPDNLTLHWLDFLVIAGYLFALAAIGIYHSRKQKDLKDFFLAGREMRWLVVGTSLMAALNSGIDYLMQPSAMIKFGAYTMVGNFSWLLLYPYVFFVTLPLYRRLGVISAYEYLERRFDVRVRTLTASIFILWRLGWLATALYVPALALTAAMGKPEAVSPIIVGIGIIVTFYTMMGGIRAVVWTDLTQFCIMFLGLAVTIVIILQHVDGGIVEILGQWSHVGSEAVNRLSPEAAAGGAMARTLGFFAIPVTLTGVFMATIVSRLTTYTSDQVMVQRFQTAKSIRDARQGFVITAVSDVVWMLALGFIGLALFAYYQANFGGIPAWARESPDQLFPYFMTQVFPVGIVGLVIAAILAASLSSIDSAINSLTSVGMVDFYNRIYRNRETGVNSDTPEEERHQVRVSRYITAAVGAIGIVLACNVSRLGSLLEISNRIINSFTGPILGIYLLGMFTRRVNSAGVLAAGAIGVAVTVYTAFQAQIHGIIGVELEEYISFLWPPLFGFLTTFLGGLAFSAVFKTKDGEKGGRWNWFAVTRETLVE